MNRTKLAIASTITAAMILGSTIVFADRQDPSVELEVKKVRGGGAIFYKN